MLPDGAADEGAANHTRLSVPGGSAVHLFAWGRRAFGGAPEIRLEGFGGVTYPRLKERPSAWKQIALSIAGPLAGLGLGLLATLVSRAYPPEPGSSTANVLDLVRRWAGKRERITVHTAATLLEFQTAADLEAALTRGLVTQKVTDRIGIANGEVDYKHFRLMGNRDYEAKPQRCVTFAPDGVTFTVDVAAADLLLEAELARLAEPVAGDGPERRYRITPATARSVRDQGLTLSELDQWSVNRAGGPLAASARLLFAGSAGVVGDVRRRLVLTLPSEAVTDGVCQWPETADARA